MQENLPEIRSEEIQEIMGTPPAWIIRAGIGVVFSIIAVLIIGSWIFRYPDSVRARFSLTTENPPVSLKAMASGKISEIFVSEKETVSQNQIIALISDPADFNHIQYLQNILDDGSLLQKYSDIPSLNLGELQSTYSTLTRLSSDYLNFVDLNYYSKRAKMLSQQKKELEHYITLLHLQKSILEESFTISESEFEREKRLYESGVYARADFDRAGKVLLQEKLKYENIRTSIANTQLQILQMEQQVLEVNLQGEAEIKGMEHSLLEATENLRSQITDWKHRKIIVSPIEGNVTFTRVWSKNQNVDIGDIVATVVPLEQTKLIGKVAIPATGIGKVKNGQNANLKLDGFPHLEFGTVRGVVSSISLVPIASSEEGVFYVAELELPYGLISNIGAHLGFTQEMTGVAEIITEEVRLLERLLYPLRAIWKENIK